MCETSCGFNGDNIMGIVGDLTQGLYKIGRSSCKALTAILILTHLNRVDTLVRWRRAAAVLLALSAIPNGVVVVVVVEATTKYKTRQTHQWAIFFLGDTG
jgi:hypothetical protein